MFNWIKNRFFCKQHEGVNLPDIPAKDVEYARAMHRCEDYFLDEEYIYFDEAYNFHMDCGDR